LTERGYTETMHNHNIGR